MFANETDNTLYCETVMISSHFSKNPNISGQLTYKCFKNIEIIYFYESLDWTCIQMKNSKLNFLVNILWFHTTSGKI